MNFVHDPLTPRVLFGPGVLQALPSELGRLGLKRVLVISTLEQRGLAELVSDHISERVAGFFDRATMHVPAPIVEDAVSMARDLGIDGYVAAGGGSTIGLAKMLALQSSLPILAIPTTYAGSEMTSIFGITESELKRTGRDKRVLPRTVIYDPELTLSLPSSISVTSGVNAIAHAVEGLYAPEINPILSIMAQQGIAALAKAIPKIRIKPADLKARSDALYGAWMCGSVLGNVSMALHHKLCHTLGGTFNLPHAETHTIILPHALAYNSPAIPTAIKLLQEALSILDPARALYDLAKSNGAPVSLRSIGMKEADLGRACDLVMSAQYPNPRPLEKRAIAGLLRRAYFGQTPQP
ncbi:maleylacetate reductase [Cupriavidus sp. DL-D2]|uniref:maleylacetate reductase n=1 Tax=Cupriavidus sp. DL-D2 TaxID=3144974 RepID=UPI0032143FF9